MTYSVYQHWDPLKVCIVGKSYSPEFYSFIDNPRVRTVMENIAQETEEDYQKLIKLLNSFNVEVLRPTLSNDHTDYLDGAGKIKIPPMTPRDYSIMLGEQFFFEASGTIQSIYEQWDILRGDEWPAVPPTTPAEIDALPDWIKIEIESFIGKSQNEWILAKQQFDWEPQLANQKVWGSVIDHIRQHNPCVYNRVPGELSGLNSAMTTRIGKDIYLGTDFYHQDMSQRLSILNEKYTEYRWHIVDTGGHSDGTFCPVVPGLIVSLYDVPTYAETFPDWEVIYLPGQSWQAVTPFLDLKEKNKGKWWVPGQELNDEFTKFVESWLDHWVGYVEETVFDVNMLVIDEKNVVCNNYNKEVFDAFDRYGITPHVVNFRHRYFWDGGLHCITSDVHREGTMKDYFPGRS